MGLKHRVGMFVVALVAATTLAACEIEVGNFEASIGGNPHSFTITMYQGQDATGGETVTLEEVQDKGPLILHYFDLECEQCPGGLQVLQNFYAENQDGPTVLVVYVGHLTGKGNDEDAKRMLAETRATFPAGFTTDALVIEEYDLEAMPSTSFYKENGHFRSKIAGGLLETDLRKSAEGIRR